MTVDGSCHHVVTKLSKQWPPIVGRRTSHGEQCCDIVSRAVAWLTNGEKLTVMGTCFPNRYHE